MSFNLQKDFYLNFESKKGEKLPYIQHFTVVTVEDKMISNY